MSNKYDVETFRNEIIAFMQDGLTKKITDITAEKADNIIITSIPTKRWYNNLMEQRINGFPIIWFGINDIEPKQSAGNVTLLEITIFICIVFDNTNQTETETKGLRYTRALREVIQDNYAFTSSSTRLQVIEFLPHDVKLPLNDGADFKVAGILVRGTIAG